MNAGRIHTVITSLLITQIMLWQFNYYSLLRPLTPIINSSCEEKMNPWLRRDSVSSISVFPKFQPKLIQTEIAASYWFTMTALILLLQKHEFFSRLKTGIGSTPYSRVHFYLSWSKPLVTWIKNTFNCEESSHLMNWPTHFLYVLASAAWQKGSSALAMRWIFLECSFSALVFAVIHTTTPCWCQKLQIVAELWWRWYQNTPEVAWKVNMWLFIFVPVLMIIFPIVPSLLDGYPTGGLSLLAGWLAGPINPRTSPESHTATSSSPGHGSSEWSNPSCHKYSPHGIAL